MQVNAEAKFQSADPDFQMLTKKIPKKTPSNSRLGLPTSWVEQIQTYTSANVCWNWYNTKSHDK